MTFSPWGLAALVIAIMAIFTVAAGAWAARCERQRLLVLAKRYGVHVSRDMPNEEIEAGINRKFSGWVSR